MLGGGWLVLSAQSCSLPAVMPSRRPVCGLSTARQPRRPDSRSFSDPTLSTPSQLAPLSSLLVTHTAPISDIATTAPAVAPDISYAPAIGNCYDAHRVSLHLASTSLQLTQCRSMATTRRTRHAAPAEPAHSAPERGTQQETPPPEPPKRKPRKGKAAAAVMAESHVESDLQPVAKVRAATRAASSSTTTTTATTSTAPKRRTRAAERAGVFSPLRALESQPKRLAEKKRKRTTGPDTSASATPEPEPAQSASAQHDNDEPQGIFFTQSELQISSSLPQNTLMALSQGNDDVPAEGNQHVRSPSTEKVLRSENFQLHARVHEVEDRVTGLEEANANLVDSKYRLVDINEKLAHENVTLRSQLASIISTFRPSSPETASQQCSPFSQTSPHVSQQPPAAVSQQCSPLPQTSPNQSQQCDRLSQHSLLHYSQNFSPTSLFKTGQASTNSYPPEFDHDMMHVDGSSPAQPVFVNGSESAIALLHKIENAAKEPYRVEPPLHNDGETVSNHDITMESSRHSTSNASAEPPFTPARSVATPSGFFSRSFSALKSKFGFTASTPQAPPSSQVASVTSSASRPLPPRNTFTETLSLPPTPIGERAKTPAKKKKTNTMLRTLLKGIEHNEKTKAEDWAKQILPQLKNDPAFREKRKRLETPLLIKDLNHFPSAKPWETGFGDPLGDLDDEDVVPGWAVYLDMIAEEEDHKTKKHKTTHQVTIEDDDDILSINEQYAVKNGGMTPVHKLYDSNGHSASLQDFHPRRSIDPSPMFDTPVSHQQGGNVFSELRGHDTTAKIRANGRDSLQQVTKQIVHTHDPTMGSFSVPDESDDEDLSMNSESSDGNGTPLWTQPPPPAPVPAHAPLPGGAPADAPAVPVVQQPVDEVERQRQKLMKHTPAKPSRLREATYPSPSLLSEAGNESLLAATPAQVEARMAHIFADMPIVEPLDIDDEDLQAANALRESAEWKAAMAAHPWPAPILTYDSEEEGVSPE